MDKKYALNAVERWWRDHQQWLETCGYSLRPRYVLGWQGPANQEETMKSTSWVMDATRIKDDAVVALKLVELSDGVSVSKEERIMRLLNSEPLASHPDNPCPTLYDVLDVPNDPREPKASQIFVMPFLRKFDSPPFETVGEIMDFAGRPSVASGSSMNIISRMGIDLSSFDQAVCSSRPLRDSHYMNIMLAANKMYPNGFYPGNPSYAHRTLDVSARAKAFTRTQRPPRYYWIDYGLSSDEYQCSDPSGRLRVPYARGGDKDIPETQNNCLLADPFASDVWWLGNLIETHLIKRYSGLNCLKPMVAAMRKERPEDRPTMIAVAAQFDLILKRSSSWRLRCMTVRRKHLVGRFLKGFPAYIAHTVPYFLGKVPALPHAQRNEDDNIHEGADKLTEGKV
ncbi:hypothetical protein B0H10DRAFT_2227725 [Mycena sp. CBHHK59/15]|nr:hypothetical protein B0H10DRAFT_2227725 [Mycena sp. CBHHK59/15]